MLTHDQAGFVEGQQNNWHHQSGQARWASLNTYVLFAALLHHLFLGYQGEGCWHLRLPSVSSKVYCDR